MFNGTLKILAYVFLGFLISGCTARAYKQVRGRVDQNMRGNAGYIQGAPPPEATDRSGIRKTRTTYVLEILTKDKKLDEALQEAPKTQKPALVPESKAMSQPIETKPPSLEPVVPPSSSTVSESAAVVEYTVEKGDTLQKISKKFYDTYRRWNKIYEANKDKIKTPDHIKPGTVLKIPPK